MAIIKVNRIKNITALDRYLLSHEAHEKTDLVRVRNFTVFGHNVMKTYDHKFDAMYLASQQWAVRKVAKKQKKKTQGFHMIVSFSQEDFPEVATKDDLKKQVIQARSLLKGFLDEELPDESQWYATIQRDGDGHKLHAHVAINSVRLDGRTLDTNILSLNRKLEKVKQKKKEQEEAKEAEKTKDKKKKEKKKPKYIAKIGLYERFQNYCAKNFEKETGRKYTKIMRNEKTMHTGKEGAYLHRVHKRFEKATSWREDIASSIRLISPRATSLDDFKALMYKAGRIRVDERRASYIDADGKKQTRTAYTYCKLDKDDKVVHKVRDYRKLRNGSVRGLGKSTTPQAIQLVIDRNIQLKMAKEQQEREEKNREAILKANELKREREKAKREKKMNEILLANKRKEQQKKREQEQAKQCRLQEERRKQQQRQRDNGENLGF